MPDRVEDTDSKLPAPNPQGKGLTPVLSDWQQFSPRDICTKSPQQLLADYFASMLVLSAEFHFKPVVGQSYYLYCREGHWQLSLIEPERWTTRNPGDCLGMCVLESDMTWSIERQPGAAIPPALKVALQHFADQLSDYVSQQTDRELLPFHQASLPYYRRLAASGLARSLSLNPSFSPRDLQLALTGALPSALLQR